MATRAELLAYATARFGTAAVLAGMESDEDTIDGFKLPLDKTFRALGVAADLLSVASVGTDKDEDAEALMDYYSLDHIIKKILTRRDPVVGSGSVSFKPSTELGQLRDERVQARLLVEMLGYDTGGAAWDSGTLTVGNLGGHV